MNPPAFLLQVSPARASSARDLPALEIAMQSLALDAKSPVALELAATATSRHFLLRASKLPALQHLEQQIQARYPQAVISPASADPLVLRPGEVCSVYELRPGAASYLPLRSWKSRDLLEEGSDPLLGILGAFSDLSQNSRAIAQLAILPASPIWSKGWRRRAVEHPLEKERARERLGASSQQAPSIGKAAMLFVLVMLLALLFSFRQPLSKLIPSWLLESGSALLHGKGVHLSQAQTAELTTLGIMLLLLALALLYGVGLVMGRLGQTAIYDQHLVDEKTARPAYRVRLRLYVIAPGFLEVQRPSHWQERIRTWLLRTRRRWRRLYRVLANREGEENGVGTLARNSRVTLSMLRRRWAALIRLLRTRRKLRLDRENVLRSITASYRQYHLAAGGYFIPKSLARRRIHRLLLPPKKGLIRCVGWYADLPRSGHMLSVADLATLWHLPQAQDLAELPYVERSMMRTLLAPTQLATEDGYCLGVSTHAGQSLPVFLPFSCLAQNALIAASTGKGKSNLLEHLTRAFALARLAGHPAGNGGVLFVDPHGDQADHLCGTLPANLIDDIMLIRLADRDYPVGFNPLDMSRGQDRDKIIDNLIQVVEALWPTSYGPRTENFLEYGCKTLAEANLTIIANDPINGPEQQFTLLDIVHLFRQETFRRAVFELVRDKHILNWWTDYYEQLDGRQQAEFTSSLITKMSKFASSKISRRILGQPQSSLNFTELIDQNKLVLISCSAGDVGADLAALFGSLLLGFFQIALAEQARLHPLERHRCLVLIDEFQVLKVDYQTMLAELRKYGGSFTLATQSLAYLDRFERTLRATVLANIDHVFAFTMSNDDARLLHLPGIEPEDLTQLPDYACYARLSLAGQRLPTFSLHLAAPANTSEELRKEIVNRARMRYGRPVGLVDQQLLDSEARMRTMRPSNMRRGVKGYEVVWTGTGDNRVREVLDAETQEKKHRRGKSRGVDEESAVSPQHTMYAPGDPVNQPSEAIPVVDQDDDE